MLVQNAAPPAQLGVATTAVRFAQILGSAAGTALFGIILNRVAGAQAGTGVPVERAADALVAGIDAVFLSAAGVMAAALLLALPLRTERPAPAAFTV